jgi:hypothetical protein
MPFRFNRRIKIFPGVTINLGKRGITSTTLGKTNFRKGYTPKTTIRLFRGLSWFVGGKRKF